MPQPPAPSPRRTFSLTGVLTAVGGLAAARVGRDARRRRRDRDGRARRSAGVSRSIVAIGGLRFLLRAAAWRLCLDPPHRLRLRDAFAAVICGDAIGNLTPLGPLVGEPAKAAFVRGRVALAPALTALAIENVLYTLSAAAMIAAGMVALLVRFQLPPDVRGVGELAIAGTFALFVAALWMLWRQPALLSRALGMRPAAAETRRSDPADRGGDLHVRLASPARPARAGGGGDRVPRARRRRDLPDAVAPERGTPALALPRFCSKPRTA